MTGKVESLLEGTHRYAFKNLVAAALISIFISHKINSIYHNLAFIHSELHKHINDTLEIDSIGPKPDSDQNKQAIICVELITNLSPLAGGIVNNTLRPIIPSNCDHEWRALMEQCWAPNPGARPSFTEITSRLRIMSAAASQTKTQGNKASK